MPNVHQAQYLVNEIELNKGKNPERFKFFLRMLSELFQVQPNEEMFVYWDKVRMYRRDLALSELKNALIHLREGKSYILTAFKIYKEDLHTYKFSEEDMGITVDELQVLLYQSALKKAVGIVERLKQSFSLDEYMQLNDLMYIGDLSLTDINLTIIEFNDFKTKECLLNALNLFVKVPVIENLVKFNEIVVLSKFTIQDACRMINISDFQYKSRISTAFQDGAKKCYLEALKFEKHSLKNLNLMEYYLEQAGNVKLYALIHTHEDEVLRLRAALESMS